MANEKNIAVQRIYISDASLEVPNAPKVFQGEWKPEVDVQLNTATSALGNDHHEVALRVTVTAKQGEDTAYIVEVKQAGIFQITGFEEGELRQALGAYCPNLLFPYVREACTELVNKASFPQFILQPVNFDAVYQQHLNSLKKAQEESEQQVKH